jgi:phosphatidylethanolamine/phosphatidyl-N-methylethanolamine N-methyltransferase
MSQNQSGQSRFPFSFCSCQGNANPAPSRELSFIYKHTEDNARGDRWRFLKAWRARPLQIAALAPSGAALARIITSELSPETGRVLELGPGTGVFTRAILARGVNEADLTLVEYEEAFANLLTGRFPEAVVLQMSAASLMSDARFQQSGFGAVISGLPLLSMSPRIVLKILRGSFAALEEDGAFFQFTYGPVCPVPRKLLDRLGLKATHIGGTFANIPPARVYRISRRSTLSNP